MQDMIMFDITTILQTLLHFQWLAHDQDRLFRRDKRKLNIKISLHILVGLLVD